MSDWPVRAFLPAYLYCAWHLAEKLITPSEGPIEFLGSELIGFTNNVQNRAQYFKTSNLMEIVTKLARF